MRKNVQLRPKLEFLEDRTCPALTLRNLPGQLILSGTPTGATLDITGTGTLFKIMDGAKFLGNYKIANLVLNLQHYNTAITIDMNGQKIGGNVLIQRGNGNLNPAVGSNEMSILDGTIGGSLTVTGGRGNETLNLGDFAGTTPLRVGGNVTVIGRNTPFATLDGDDFRLRDKSSIGGSLTLVNTPAIALGATGGTSANVGGNLVVNNFGSNKVMGLSLNGGATIGKSVSVTGTNVQSPTLSDSVAVDATSTVAGNLSANLLNGVNFWLLGGTYNGDVALAGGEGESPGNAVNFVELDDGTTGATIAGSVSLTMGNADFGLVFLDTASIAGDFNISLGNGTNDLGGGAFAGLWQGDVAGDVQIRVGNGDNVFTFDGTTASVGGKLSYFGGTGVDTLSLSGVLNAIALYLGNGDDDLTFVAGTTVSRAVIDFGGGVDSYTPNDVVFGTLLLRDLP